MSTHHNNYAKIKITKLEENLRNAKTAPEYDAAYAKGIELSSDESVENIPPPKKSLASLGQQNRAAFRATSVDNQPQEETIHSMNAKQWYTDSTNNSLESKKEHFKSRTSNIPRSASIERISSDELKRRSFERKVQKNSAYLRANNIVDNDILVPNNVSTETLHRLLCTTEPPPKNVSQSINGLNRQWSPTKIPNYRGINDDFLKTSSTCDEDGEDDAILVLSSTPIHSRQECTDFIPSTQLDNNDYVIPSTSVPIQRNLTNSEPYLKAPTNLGVQTPEKGKEWRTTPDLYLTPYSNPRSRHSSKPAGTDNETSFESAMSEPLETEPSQSAVSNRITVIEQKQTVVDQMTLTQSRIDLNRSLSMRTAQMEKSAEISEEFDASLKLIDEVKEKMDEAVEGLNAMECSLLAGRNDTSWQNPNVSSASSKLHKVEAKDKHSQTTARLNPTTSTAQQCGSSSSSVSVSTHTMPVSPLIKQPQSPTSLPMNGTPYPNAPAKKLTANAKSQFSTHQREIHKSQRGMDVPNTKHIRYVEKKHIEALRDYIRAQLYLLEEQRLSNTPASYPTSSVDWNKETTDRGYSQRSDELLKKYQEKKAKIHAELRDTDEVPSATIDRHSRQTNLLQAETLKIQKQVKRYVDSRKSSSKSTITRQVNDSDDRFDEHRRIGATVEVRTPLVPPLDFSVFETVTVPKPAPLPPLTSSKSDSILRSPSNVVQAKPLEPYQPISDVHSSSRVGEGQIFTDESLDDETGAGSNRVPDSAKTSDGISSIHDEFTDQNVLEKYLESDRDQRKLHDIPSTSSTVSPATSPKGIATLDREKNTAKDVSSLVSMEVPHVENNILNEEEELSDHNHGISSHSSSAPLFTSPKSVAQLRSLSNEISKSLSLSHPYPSIDNDRLPNSLSRSPRNFCQPSVHQKSTSESEESYHPSESPVFSEIPSHMPTERSLEDLEDVKLPMAFKNAVQIISNEIQSENEATMGAENVDNDAVEQSTAMSGGTHPTVSTESTETSQNTDKSMTPSSIVSVGSIIEPITASDDGSSTPVREAIVRENEALESDKMSSSETANSHKYEQSQASTIEEAIVQGSENSTSQESSQITEEQNEIQSERKTSSETDSVRDISPIAESQAEEETGRHTEYTESEINDVENSEESIAEEISTGKESSTASSVKTLPDQPSSRSMRKSLDSNHNMTSLEYTDQPSPLLTGRESFGMVPKESRFRSKQVDLAILAGSLNDTGSPRDHIHQLRSPRSPRSPRERFTTRYPGSPRSQKRNSLPMSPIKLKQCSSPSSVNLATKDFKQHSSSSRSAEDDSISLDNFQLLDEIPGADTLDPILDISRNSLEPSMRFSMGKSSPLWDNSEKLNSLDEVQGSVSATKYSPLAEKYNNNFVASSILEEEEDEVKTLVGDQEDVEEVSRKEIEENKKIANINMVIDEESDKIWNHYITNGSVEHLVEYDEKPREDDNKASYQFRKIMAHWSWEIAAKSFKVAKMRGNIEHSPLSNKHELRRLLRGFMLPKKDNNSKVPRIVHSHEGIKRRAERTSHILLDERRQLFAQEFYESELFWPSKSIQEIDEKICTAILRKHAKEGTKAI
ncbi:hypothetical protein DdX_07250 [Ditylenchus destructor]|uniref:Uncharacterized protein n=1 Tax=Ditylenchus destructor TaxID=166010 RepID=A0AAD4N977_9BILA|nr:hypothetical protein DdX_07250 [Ditylenchus destructor]